MPAPKGNDNALKNSKKREMFSTRLPPDVIKAIKQQAKLKEISQADYISQLVREENK